MLRRPPVLLLAVLTLPLLVLAGPAQADHTAPGAALSPIEAQPGSPALTAGEGTWKFIGNVGPMEATDLEYFTKGGVTYVSGGTLGQAPTRTPGFVGQRIVQLTDNAGQVAAPKLVADHGSAHCEVTAASAAGTTGLQHDVQAVPSVETELLIDTTDAAGRCHDTPGGGMEILDVSGLGTDGFEVREIGLIRFNGTTHTVTADVKRPGILYNNGAEFGTGTGKDAIAQAWVDVVDVRSCMGLTGKTLDQKRAACRPTATRFPYQPEWTSKKLADGTLTEPASCHDITARDDRLYCAALNASLILDISGVLDASGKVAGTPLPCTLIDGTRTTAKVTDCAFKPAGATTTAPPTAAEAIKAYADMGRPAATGIRFLGTFNHPGRNCSPVPATTCNTNTVVRSDLEVAVSHEADPTPDPKHMLVTDERGGGIVPPGATCAPGLDNPVGNGGIHVYDISDPAKIVHVKAPDGSPAVYIGTSPTPSPTFCTVHVIEQVPGEARIVAAYYDGGTKIVDYAIDEAGAWTFKEVAAYRLPGANTWASEVFKTQDNPDGTRTYFFTSTSFGLGEGTARGIDVFSWTGVPNPLKAASVAQPPAAPPAGNPPPPAAPPSPPSGGLPATGPDRLVLLLAGVLLPAAVVVRLLRRRLAPSS